MKKSLKIFKCEFKFITPLTAPKPSPREEHIEDAPQHDVPQPSAAGFYVDSEQPAVTELRKFRPFF